MGKTALLQALQGYISAHNPNTPVLWLDSTTISNGNSLIDAFTIAWQTTAQALLDRALADINAINDPLGIIWNQTDLLRAITLMKLQTDVDSLAPQGEFLPRQRLANAIRSAIPKVKRLHFSAVNLGIRQLVERLQDPWLQISAQIIHPSIAPTADLFGPTNPITKTDDKPAPVLTDEPTLSTSDPSHHAPRWQAMDTFCHWLDNQLATTPYRITCLLDNWDTLAKHAEGSLQHAFISFLNILAGTRHHCVATCRSDVLSSAFSGPLIDYFLAPIILPPLNAVAQQKLVHHTLAAQPPTGTTPAPTLTDDALNRVLTIGGGNPHLLIALCRLIAQHAQQRHTTNIDVTTIAALGIESDDDLTETLFSRVLLEHMPHENNVLKTIASLLEFSHALTPFALEDMVSRIHLSQQLGRVFVNSVLATLEREQFLTPIYETGPDNSEAYMAVANRSFLAFMRHKTRWVETDLPCDEKLAYLKKVIPLAIQAGEFDANRTREAIAMASSKGFDELKPFLENALVEAITPTNPVAQRLTAMASLTSLGSPTALTTLLTLTEETTTPIIQEYALRHLKTWTQHQHLPPKQTQQVLARLLELLDVTPIEHRRLTYQTIAALPMDHGAKAVVAIYLKGLVDQDDTIRTIAIQQLAHADLNSALVRQAIIDATQDTSDAVREHACRILKHNPHPKVMEALLAVLEHDKSPYLRQLAAQIIGQHPSEQTTQTLLNALTMNLETDIHIAIVRSLRHHPVAMVEPVLHQSFQTAWRRRRTQAQHSGLHTPNTGNTPDELLWAYCQTFKEMAHQGETLATLKHALQQAEQHNNDAILITALQSTVHTIQSRLTSGHTATPLLPQAAEEAPPNAIATTAILASP